VTVGVPYGLTNVNVGGVDFAAVDDTGIEWFVDDIDGWEGSPASTLAVTQKTRAAGGWAGKAYAGSRHISMAGHLRSTDPSLMLAAKDILNAAIGLDDTPAVFTELGVSRSIIVRRNDEVIVKRDTLYHAAWSVQVIALDPRKFTDPVSGSTFLPSSTGGLIIGGAGVAPSTDFVTPDQLASIAHQDGFMVSPASAPGMYDLFNSDGSPATTDFLTVPATSGDALTVPFSIDSTIVSGLVSLTNPGNEVGPVSLRIDGPCTGPVITHVASGAQLVFSSSLVLGAGEWIDVDMEAHEVLANGQASRAGWITERGWSGFDPGSNTWTFTAAAYDPNSKLTVSATPSWK
jgi:hypothetical protein